MPKSENYYGIPKNQMNNIIISAILILLLSVVVTGQKKEKVGHLYGHVVLETLNERKGELLPRATVELLRKNKKIIIIANEAGLITKKLPTGKYRVLSVKSAESEQLTFSKNQILYFEIKKNKTTRFDIGVLKPKTSPLVS